MPKEERAAHAVTRELLSVSLELNHVLTLRDERQSETIRITRLDVGRTSSERRSRRGDWRGLQLRRERRQLHRGCWRRLLLIRPRVLARAAMRPATRAIKISYAVSARARRRSLATGAAHPDS